MEDVVCVRIHEASLQIQVSCYRNQEFDVDPGSSGQAKGENLTLIDNKVFLCIHESKTKKPAMRWVDRHMQISILQVQ